MIVRPDWKIEGEIQISTWQSIKECTQEYPALLRPLVLVMSRRHHQLWDSTVRNYSNQCQHCGKNNQIYYIHTETGTLCIFEHYSTIKNMLLFSASCCCLPVRLFCRYIELISGAQFLACVHITGQWRWMSLFSFVCFLFSPAALSSKFQ